MEGGAAAGTMRCEQGAQAGLQGLEEYGHVNAALQVRRGYELLRGQGLDDAQAKAEISETLRWRTKDVESSLKFLEVADMFLDAIGKKSRYDLLILAGDRDGRETALILREVSVQRDKFRKEGMPPDLLARWLVASCLFARLAADGAAAVAVPRSGWSGGAPRGPRLTCHDYRRFSEKVMADDQISKKFLGLSLFESPDAARTADAGDAHGFLDAVRLHEWEFDAKHDAVSPAGNLERAAQALAAVGAGLQGANRDEMLRALRGGRGREILSDIAALAEDISRRVK